MPAHDLSDHAPGQQPHCGPGRGHEAEDAEGLGLLLRLREEADDHGQDHGRAGRAADALDEAGADQNGLRGRKPAGQGGGGEDPQTQQEDALAAHQVGQPAGQQQEAGKGDQIAVDHPGQAAGGEAQVAADRRQGDVDDRHVHHDQQEPGAEDEQRNPA